MSLSFTFEEIEELLREYDPVPLFAEFVADTDTPLSLYLKLREGWKHSFLLESAEGGAKWGRYSFIVLSSGSYYAFKEGTGYLYREGKVKLFQEKDPLRPVEELLRSFRPYRDRRLPRFWGGLVGYVGYEVVSSYEPVGRPDRDALELFDLFMVMSQVVVVHDNLSGSIKVIVPLRREGGALQEYQRARETIQEVKRRIFKTAVQPVHLSTCEPELQEWHSNFTQESFMEAVSRAKNYIAQGDVVQVVLSQRFGKSFSGKPENIYRALRHLNPSSYMYYADLGELKLVGSSPEVLVRLEEGRIHTRPIAGTRRRGQTEEEDLKLEKELTQDPKERAEHLMLVDLARNDVGRVSKPGSVKVESFMRVERYSHVMHMVSDVVGELREGLSATEVLRAVFPAGTVSGAPKVRAMQIIRELEGEARGVYAGAVGYISFEGNMDMAIAIRTAVVLGGQVFVQAGAGVVADSDPYGEWLETVNKAKALMKAVRMAESVHEEG